MGMGLRYRLQTVFTWGLTGSPTTARLEEWGQPFGAGPFFVPTRKGLSFSGGTPRPPNGGRAGGNTNGPLYICIVKTTEIVLDWVATDGITSTINPRLEERWKTLFSTGDHLN